MLSEKIHTSFGFQEGMFRWDVSLRIRRVAVALCRAAGGTRTCAAVAAELGITGETLRSWVRKDTAQLAPERREAGTGQSPAGEPARLRAENARLLKAERGVAAGARDPPPGSHLFRSGGEVRACRWDFISGHRTDFGAKRLCRVLGVSGSGYYRHLATEEARAERRVEEAGWSQRFAPSTPSTTAAVEPSRVHAELGARGWKINRRRVTRLTRIDHVIGLQPRRRKRTTVADKTAPLAPDLMMRDFTAKALNTK